jgi:nicotinamide-nucleotide amidase
MKADIISIGDELLIGQTVNTNASWLGKELGSRGIRIMQVTAIPDDEAKIIEAFDEAFRRSEIIIVTGGLGPTKDDITKHTLCKYFKTHLVMHEPTREKIHSFFERRNRPMLDVNTRQAELPASCEILKNDYGTASGMWFEDEKGILVSLPGVPYEMKGIVNEEVIPRLEQRYELKSLYHVTLMTQGLGESFLADRISDWEDRVRDAGLGLAYLPSPGLVKLRLTSYEGASREQEIRNYFSELEARLPNYVFGYDDATLPEVLGQLLRSGSYTIGTVESCTAGNLAGSISSVSGASDYFMGSLITYSNAMKIQLAGVNPDLIQQHGAVSREVAEAMAQGGLERLGVDVCVATSGIAGPTGGTEEKPVGLVWIAIALKNKVVSKEFRFGDDRSRNIQMTIWSALNLVRCEILEINTEKK